VSPARLAAQALELLGPVDGPVAVLGPDALVRAVAKLATVATDDGAAAIVCFIGTPLDVLTRQAQLATLRARLVSGAPLVLVDHNQPRTWPRRFVAAACLVLRGLRPARARHPAARELQALGLRVERLRFAAGERLQLVLARR